MNKRDNDNGVFVRSYIDRDRNLVIGRGRFEPLYQAYLAHAERWDALPSAQAREMMRSGLAATTLQLCLLPPDEFVAWTLNIMHPALNFFLTGDNSEFIIVGRVFTQDVKTAASSRLYVETQRPKHEPTRSSLDVEGLDVFGIFEQYYRKAVQVPTRLFRLAQDECVIIQGMPKADRDWLKALEPDSVARLLERELEFIQERFYRFHCGCHPGKILKAVSQVYGGRADELFQQDEQVEIDCPRCGRRWWITREDFDLGPSKVGIS